MKYYLLLLIVFSNLVFADEDVNEFNCTPNASSPTKYFKASFENGKVISKTLCENQADITLTFRRSRGLDV